MSNDIRSLSIPPEVMGAEIAQELIRFWVADGVDHVSINIGSVRTEKGSQDEAGIWGVILADVAKHAVNAIRQDTFEAQSENILFAELERAFANRLKEKTNYSGQLLSIGNAH